MKINRKSKGFTIIEVVLVLAIAGLIFMMVFIALPALQRSQRDTQRKSDLSRAMTGVTSYTQNNNGSLPTNWATFTTQYLTKAGDSFIDPSGAGDNDTSATYYGFKSSSAVTLASSFDSTTQNIIYYTTGATCGAGGSITSGAGNRKVALRMYLEGGGVTCQNN